MSQGSWNAFVAKSLPDATGPGPLSVTAIWADARPAVHSSARAHSNNDRVMVPRSRKDRAFETAAGTVVRSRRQRTQKALSVVLGISSITDGSGHRQRLRWDDDGGPYPPTRAEISA